MSAPDPTVIRSTSNPRIRHLVRMRDNRARKRAQRVIVDGWRETAQAIQAGLPLVNVYRAEGETPESHLPPSADKQRVERSARVQGKLTLVSTPVMEKISYGQSARGVVAEFEQPSSGLCDLAIPPSALLLVLDQIEKPGNLGAVFRCADAAGVAAILLCDGADVFNPNAIRSRSRTVQPPRPGTRLLRKYLISPVRMLMATMSVQTLLSSLPSCVLR